MAYMGHGTSCMADPIIAGVCQACITTGCDVNFESIGCSIFKDTDIDFEFFKNQVDELPEGASVTISCNQCDSNFFDPDICQPRVEFSYSNDKCSESYISCDELDNRTKCTSPFVVITCSEDDGALSQRICSTQSGEIYGTWVPYPIL
jgi:hypothetical protein